MPTPPELTADEIDVAAKRIADIAEPTPLQRVERLSAQSGAEIYLKREDLAAVRSYKLRGAYNCMVQLTSAQRAAGVVTASAGNHAQGVAFACRVMGITGRIYVPTTTPKQKRDRIRVHGRSCVELIATGDSYDCAAAAAEADAARTGATLVHPFDDPRTTAGQGTIAVELLDQLPTAPDLVIVPVGGGGCAAGIAAYLRERSPATAILGVEPVGAASMTAALVAGKPVTLPEIDSFVDGAAVRRVGDHAYTVLSSFAGTGRFEMTTVNEGAICTTMLDLYQNEGIIAEPAGALAVAALAERTVAPGSTVVCLVSGGNNDVSRYGEVIERSLVHRGLKHYFLVNFPQEPGALRRFLDQVLGPDDDVTLFEYVKRNNRETGTALVGIEMGSPEGLQPLRHRMDHSTIHCELLDPGSPVYRYLA